MTVGPKVGLLTVGRSGLPTLSDSDQNPGARGDQKDAEFSSQNLRAIF
jgi:hypothetical protein